jgi:hypothetical protein
MSWYLNPQRSDGIISEVQHTGYEPQRRSVEYACWCGRLKLVKWLDIYLGDQFRIDLAMAAASIQGDSIVVKWIMNRFPDWATKMTSYTKERIFTSMVRNEDTETLELFRDSGLLDDVSGPILTYTVEERERAEAYASILATES